MIFTASESHGSQRVAKLAHREVFAAEPATPSFLKWPELPITFDHTDHPTLVPRLGSYPLVVDPIVGVTHLSKVLMDGGSSLDFLYAETLDTMGSAHPTSGRPGHRSMASSLGNKPSLSGRSICS